MVINAVCETTGQAEALASVRGLGRIYSPANTMPYVFRNEDADRCRCFLKKDRLLVRNMDELGFLRENGYRGEITADHTLYTFNSPSREFLSKLGVSYDTAPLELTYHELKDRGMENSELMIYGRVPMMISAGCIYRNAGDDKCIKNDTGRMSGLKAGDMKHTVRLTDRMKTDFPVICDCRYCYNIIFNSVPVSLHDEADKVIKLDPLALRLYFTTEKPEEAAEISEYFLRIFCRGDNSHGVEKPPCRAYTKGHFSRAVL